MEIWQTRVPGRGQSKWKGPEGERCLAQLRTGRAQRAGEVQILQGFAGREGWLSLLLWVREGARTAEWGGGRRACPEQGRDRA